MVFSFMCEVNQTPGSVCSSSPHTSSIASDADSEKRGVTAYRSRPSPCQRSISLRPSASAVSGVVSRSGRRMRSLTTWPAVILSPLRPAAAKKRSIAEAKCAPKTSAVVVPAWASAVRNSAATASA